MPTVFRYKGIRFFFFSNEGAGREPPHIHARGHGNDAKLWLRPFVRFAYCHGFDSREQNELLRVVTERRAQIESTWNEYFS